MALLGCSQPWLSDFRPAGFRGGYHPQVVCGTSTWYEMRLLLTAAEALPRELAAGHEESLTLLGRRIMPAASTGAKRPAAPDFLLWGA